MNRIANIDPKDWSNANIVQLDVDTHDNRKAIDAIEAWAAKHGFARTRENFLRIIVRPDGSRVFRGACYRLTDEEKTAIDLNFKETVERARRIGRATRAAG